MNRTLILGNRLFFRTGPILLLLLFSLESGAHAVGAATATSTTLSVTPGMTISQGTALTLQAAVSAGGSPVTGGSVTFYDGARVLTVVQVVYAGSTYAPGTANCKLFLGPGSHSLLAVYAGTASFLPSTSVAASVTVAVASSAVTTLELRLGTEDRNFEV